MDDHNGRQLTPSPSDAETTVDGRTNAAWLRVAVRKVGDFFMYWAGNRSAGCNREESNSNETYKRTVDKTVPPLGTKGCPSNLGPFSSRFQAIYLSDELEARIFLSSVDLHVPYYYQYDKSWCLPTSVSMLLGYYHFD